MTLSPTCTPAVLAGEPSSTSSTTAKAAEGSAAGAWEDEAEVGCDGTGAAGLEKPCWDGVNEGEGSRDEGWGMRTG